MTRSTPDEDPAELTRAVHELAGMVDRQSTVLESLAAETRSNTTQTDINTTQTDANTAQSKRNTSSNKRHAIALWITAISLLADVVITFVLFHYQAQQDCLSSLRAKSSAIASDDRDNQNQFIIDVVSGQITTRAQFQTRAKQFSDRVDVNNAKRKSLGVANSKTCPLF